ncbi:sulfurtransferase [Spelaeicoccus albus]|uniref:Thiosulfate/3-mercaptopyruvate sulfurtransferase n=1 Tax=Spelaeicoccus albus TaxID=1280376 RepID=A0A7Z0A8X0_9MICO|nr:sulfurtransferase [Spelaeicoccus albus]NYI65791.1 thiosulfate/3-mercaptopyruvate sulfurtransferase [Spelaeicoccus albus]
MSAKTPRETVLVDAESLKAELTSAPVPLLLDVRWTLADPDGRAKYDAGHLPGARYVDMERELTGPGSRAREGRHPLPRIADLQASARRWGLREGQAVVAYDDSSGLAASRLWWLLRDAGVADVRVLDGGFPAWVAAGGDVTTDVPDAERGDVFLFDGYMPRIDADGAAAFAASGRLFDARAAERFRGEIEPADPVAGHIPGARSAPATDSLDNGKFAGDDALRAHFAELGIRAGSDVAVYCGSGITAAQQALALEAVGVRASVYPASWSGWLAELRPVETGE